MAPTLRSARTHTHTHTIYKFNITAHTLAACLSFAFSPVYRKQDETKWGLTMRATRSERCRPYLATTGLRTSVTGFVGFAFRPTERFIGTKSSLVEETNRIVHFSYDTEAANEW